MWFRALRPYRLPSRLGIDAEELERRLQSRTFSSCTPAQASSLGWVPALDDAASALALAVAVARAAVRVRGGGGVSTW